MITRDDLRLVLEGFGNEMVGPEDRAAWQRVFDEVECDLPPGSMSAVWQCVPVPAYVVVPDSAEPAS